MPRLALAAAAWLLASVAATVCNKWLVAAPPGPLALVLVQTVTTAGAALALRGPRRPCAAAVPDAAWACAFRAWLLLSPALFVLGLLLNALAVLHASLSTVVVVRNVEPLLTYLLERAVRRDGAAALRPRRLGGGACARRVRRAGRRHVRGGGQL